MILSLQKKHEEVYNSVLVEMRKLNESFSKLQAEVSVTKQVKTVVSSKLFSIERQWWLNAQYSRRECLEIAGILRGSGSRCFGGESGSHYWEAGM